MKTKDKMTVKDFKKKESETGFQNAIVELAKTFGWEMKYHTKFSFYSDKGFPDLVLGRRKDKRIIFIELKRENGKTTKDQDKWLEFLQFIGQEVYLWRPSDWSEIEKVLR